MKQGSFEFRTWGGARTGAGRSPKNGRKAGESHLRRPTLKAAYPVHTVLRVRRDVGSLRTKGVFEAIREATLVAAQDDSFRIVHMSIQRNHLHLLVEAAGRKALAKGMQRFAISAARQINRVLGRTGKVFADRYHETILTTPRAVRNCISYVLNNWRKHQEDHASFAKKWLVDPFSSGLAFTGWKELEGADVLWQPSVDTYKALWVWLPKTWLLSEGWRRHGLVSAREIPSS